MRTTEITVDVLSGGQSTKIINTAATSTQSPAVAQPAGLPAGALVTVLVTPDNTCFCRKGANPTALNDGTDQILLANTTYRVELLAGEKMAFISTAGGNVYWTPAA